MLSEFLLILLLITISCLIKQMMDLKEQIDEKIDELDSKVDRFLAELANQDDDITQLRSYLEIKNE